MITVIQVPEQEALETARAVMKALGAEHPLAVKWREALRRRFGYIYRPERAPGFFSKPV